MTLFRSVDLNFQKGIVGFLEEIALVTHSKIPVLIIDDDIAFARLVDSILDKNVFVPSFAYSGKEAKQILNDRFFPIVLSDLDLGSMTGLDLIPVAKRHPEATEIIFLTGHGSVDTAIRAVREGAFDYISKSNNIQVFEREINAILKRAAKHLKLLPSEESKLLSQSTGNSKTLIGTSAPMVAMYRAIARAAISNGNVLIHGESGSGKELVARSIHDGSARNTKPFVAVNCGALTETLLESELFGHVRGAFTGAVVSKTGLFEVADGGSLFLDEIGDISLALQVKLLRAIQEGEIKPVGGTASKKVDVRVIAATHRTLSTMIQKGDFREDLYFRLKVFQIEVPPLRSRPEDMPMLVSHFLNQSAGRIGKRISSIADETLRILCAYSWPGNVRELENAIDRSVAMASSETLFPEDLPDEVRQAVGVQTIETGETVGTAIPTLPSNETLEELEKLHILNLLNKYQHNRTRTATALGIDRVTLYRKMTRYGIHAPAEAS